MSGCNGIETGDNKKSIIAHKLTQVLKYDERKTILHLILKASCISK
jgi:hypothetical protein